MVCKRISEDTKGWGIEKHNSNNLGDSENKDWVENQVYVRVTERKATVDIPERGMRDNWVHLLVSFDKESVDGKDKTVATVFVNGNFATGTYTKSGNSVAMENGRIVGTETVKDNDYPLTFGNKNSLTDGQAFYGQYDEMRLKRGASSANWAKAEYLTVTDGSFAVAGPSKAAMGGLYIVFR